MVRSILSGVGSTSHGKQHRTVVNARTRQPPGKNKTRGRNRGESMVYGAMWPCSFDCLAFDCLFGQDEMEQQMMIGSVH
eukprot:4597792-Amphidinium_carterae.1